MWCLSRLLPRLHHQLRSFSIKPQTGTDARSCRKIFNAFGDDVGQLHHLLIQFRVFGDVALNTIAIVCSVLRSS